MLGLVMLVTGSPLQTVAMITLGGIGGSFVLPDYYLSVKTRAARRTSSRRCPTCSTLLTVSRRGRPRVRRRDRQGVRAQMRGPLVEEFPHRGVHEMRRSARAAAKSLRSLADRLPR